MRAAATNVVLRNGSTALIRPVRPDEADAVFEFLQGMSVDSRQLRFFTAGPDLHGAARWATGVGKRRGVGLVATTGHPPSIVGHADYERLEDYRAEVALEVADAMRGHGLGTALLLHLAEAARAEGVTRFVADVLPENWRMLEVFRGSGFPVTLKRGREALQVEVSIDEPATVRSPHGPKQRNDAEAALVSRS